MVSPLLGFFQSKRGYIFHPQKVNVTASDKKEFIIGITEEARQKNQKKQKNTTPLNLGRQKGAVESPGGFEVERPQLKPWLLLLAVCLILLSLCPYLQGRLKPVLQAGTIRWTVCMQPPEHCSGKDYEPYVNMSRW